ncbi:hypothetical protein ACLB2K_012110 [Fragaria x ananassa]
MTTSDSDDPTRGPFSSPCFNLLWRHYHQEMKDDEERQARITSFLALVTQYLKLKEEEDAIQQRRLANRKRRRAPRRRGTTTQRRNDGVPRVVPYAGPHSPSLTSDAESAFKPENSLILRTKRDTSSILLPPKNPEMESSPEQIFILSGQSNMAGRGGVIRDHHHQHWDGVVPSESQPDPSILRLSVHLRWEAAREPLHADIDAKKVCGLGPGMSFANAVRGRVEGRMGLVPCAVGGTAIKEWARGEHLYENMVKRARESVKNGGEIKGLLWYQGESDTSSEHDVDAYHGNMVRLIDNVRQDLALPSLPIIQVAICSGDEKYLEKIREVQLGMKVKNVVCVDAKGLELKEDHLHLTTKAQVQLGQMLADAYLKHFGSADSHHPAL